MQPESASDLATLHWEYVEKTLKKHGVAQDILTIAKFHYKSAFCHGFKHGVEYANDQEEDEKEPAIGFEHEAAEEEAEEDGTPSEPYA
jgi:hypothetical protein